MQELTLNSLKKEVDSLKTIIYELQENQEPEYMTEQEEKELKATLKRHKEGKLFTQEDVERGRLENGLGI